MKFKYKKINPIFYRPIIPVELSGKNTTVPYEVLIDSGADICIFDAEIGEILGLDIKSGEPMEFTGISGGKLKTYLHDVGLKLGGWKFKIKASFSYDISENGFGILGQLGFFEHFIVKFDYPKKSIEIAHRQ